MTETTLSAADYNGHTPDVSPHARIEGAEQLVDTGTWWKPKVFPTDESLDQITPEGLVWAADEMRAHALRLVNVVFDWIAEEIPDVGRGCIAFMMAEAGMSCGRSLREVLDELLLAAERDMGVECIDPFNKTCECGACSFARLTEETLEVAP